MDDAVREDLDPETKFFLPGTETIYTIEYAIIQDNFFTERFSALAWGINHGATDKIVDSDGDGYSDIEETVAKSDIFDSESVPGSHPEPRVPHVPSGSVGLHIYCY